jgi:hypothetical protein
MKKVQFQHIMDVLTTLQQLHAVVEVKDFNNELN